MGFVISTPLIVFFMAFSFCVFILLIWFEDIKSVKNAGCLLLATGEQFTQQRD
jgi:hypothetical protein